MPQQHSRGGEDDGPPDETKTYHTEGEQEEKASENVVGPRDSFDHLNDVKSSLIDEGESVSQKGSSSQRNKRLSSGYGDHSKEDRHKKLHSVSDGSKLDHIARFTPYSSIAFIANAGYPNGSMVGGPGITPKCGVPNVFPSPLRLGEGQKMPVLHPAGAYPPSLAQLMMYQQEHYSPGTPPPHVRGLEVDSKTGILRRSHSEISPYHPLSPSSLGSHPLDVYNMSWPGQPFYPLTSSALRSPYPPSLAVSPASMARLGPSPISSGPVPMGSLPHSLMHPIGSSQQHDAQQQSNDRHQKEKEKKLAAQEAKNKQQHIKKPLNAFMLYMKEMRASVVKECTLKESAAINQILGRRWHALSREDQAKYYELARKERQLHMQLYPGWSARDNYAIHGKKKKKKRDKSHGENAGEPSTPKKCRARFGVDQQDFWCKPCRRKKKCIRYISSDENDHGKNDDDMDDDDMDMDDDQSDASPGPPPPIDPDQPPPPPLALSSMLPSSPIHRPHQDAIISPKQNGIHPVALNRSINHSAVGSGSSRSNGHSSSSQSNGEPPTSKGPSTSSFSSSSSSSSAGLSHSSSSSSSHKASSHRDSHSASHLSQSSVGKPLETSRPLFSPHLHTTSSSGPSSSASISSSLSHSTLSIPSLSSQHISHHSQQSLAAQTSPTIVHLPHPSAAASYPSLSSATSPMVMFSPQASLLGHHPAPPGMHEAFRPHITNGFPPHGLLPMHHPQGMPPPPLISAATHSQGLRVPLSEMPQDLSVKSASVSA